MSTEIEEQITVVQSEDSSAKSSGKVIKSYAREFLLSLSELEICKKLPKDFDESFLSEFQGSTYGYQDRPRVLGSSPLQPFRQTDYGSPPTRGDSSSYSRGPQRWDSRSSGKSEGDSESESGWRIGSQARRTAQNPEHDGLLGSGSFQKPPGNAPSSVVPRFRPSDNLQLNKSNEPYQPPRPYKAGPYSRRETKDSFNDETFGFSDTTTEDRAEEEKNRRAEFELMRKEQHKAFQESQKLNTGKPKDSFAEMAGLLENPNDGKLSSGLDNVLKEALPADASKLSDVSKSPSTRRPLVPPGFVSGTVDKNSASKSHLHADALMVENLELEQCRQDVKTITQERGSSNRFGEVNSSSNFKAKGGLSSILHGVDPARASGLPGTSEIFENGETLGFDSKIIGNNALGEPVRSKSILDKLFINGLTTTSDITSDILEGNDPKTYDIWSPDKLNSKFARWINEDDRKNLGNTSSEKHSSLLSLIIGDQKGGNDELNAVDIAPPVLATDVFPWQKETRSTSSKIGEMPERVSISNDPVPKPSVLTCEDLEQSMLLEIGQDISNSRSPEKERDVSEMKKDGRPGSIIDNSASQHLLSLLQGGMGLVERPPDQDQKLGKSGLPESSSADTSGIRELNPSNMSLTLESLFGTAFMKELHSAQRNSAASDGGPLPPKMGENGDGSHEGSLLRSNDGTTQLNKVTDWPDFQDTGKNMEGQPAKADSKFGGFDEGIGVQLPEEDSLINLIDPINIENSTWNPNLSSSSADLRSWSSNTSVNIMEKFSAVSGALSDERSMVGGLDPFMLHNPYNMGKPEIPYQNINPGMSSSQFRRPPMNQDRTLFHPIDSHPAHIDPHMNFMPPESVIHRDTPPHHHFPTNMGQPSFTHSNAGLGGFDHPVPTSGLQKMFMTGNHPPSHLARGVPGAAPMSMPPHPSHIPVGLIQGRNPMQGFPFGQGLPSFGVSEITPPGPEFGVGNNPPEAFQRLLEMERANPKQTHPFGTGGPSRGMYGHELEMAYRYR